MLVTYTIANDQFQLSNRNGPLGKSIKHPGPLQVGVQSACKYDLSILNINGKILAETDVRYSASEEIGVMACIQIVENTGCMVFNSTRSFIMNCSPKIVDICFIQSHLPFSYTYADGSKVLRADIFMQKKEAEKLLSTKILNRLDEQDMLIVKSETRSGSSSANSNIEMLLKAINENTNDGQLCKYVTELLASIDNWSRLK